MCPKQNVYVRAAEQHSSCLWILICEWVDKSGGVRVVKSSDGGRSKTWKVGEELSHKMVFNVTEVKIKFSCSCRHYCRTSPCMCSSQSSKFWSLFCFVSPSMFAENKDQTSSISAYNGQRTRAMRKMKSARNRLQSKVFIGTNKGMHNGKSVKSQNVFDCLPTFRWNEWCTKWVD